MMKQESNQEIKSSKSPFIITTVLGVHLAAAGFFALQGCQTKRATTEVAEPAPAPVMPPANVEKPVMAPPRPVARPTVPVAPVAESADKAGASTYTVQKGDSLSKIAAKAGVSTKELAELNNIKNANSIRIGQRLLLPAYAKAVPQAPSSTASKAPAAPKKSKPAEPAIASGESHTVQSGDSLGKLAIQYGTSVAAFREVNNLKSDTIRVGQKLVVPKGKSAAPAASEPATADAAETAAPATPAETPAAPAVEAPAAPAPAPAVTEPVMIPLSEPPVPDAAQTAPATGEAPFPYTVKEGDTLDSIAIKFSVGKSVIVSLNSLASETVQPGQKLLIPWQ